MLGAWLWVSVKGRRLGTRCCDAATMLPSTQCRKLNMIHDPCGLPQLAGQGSSIPGGEGGAPGAWLLPSVTPAPGRPAHKPQPTSPDRRLQVLHRVIKFVSEDVSAQSNTCCCSSLKSRENARQRHLLIHNPYRRLSRRGIELQWFPAACLGLHGTHLTSRYNTEDKTQVQYLPSGTLPSTPKLWDGILDCSCMFERNGSTRFHRTARMHVLLRAAGGPNGLEVQLEREAGSPSSVAASSHTTSTLLTGPPSLHLQPVAVDDGDASCTVASVPRLCQPSHDDGPEICFSGGGRHKGLPRLQCDGSIVSGTPQNNEALTIR